MTNQLIIVCKQPILQVFIVVIAPDQLSQLLSTMFSLPLTIIASLYLNKPIFHSPSRALWDVIVVWLACTPLGSTAKGIAK